MVARDPYSVPKSRPFASISSTMSAKQAGISLLKQLAVQAQTVRNALKPEFKTIAERRGNTEVKVVKFTDGVQGDVKELKAIDS
ncbi:uncharacterized protein LODBEIA_P52910 [Lodderomyces beijingensis]|uniref:Uncharacterized protein n=1 Tax=Lodderomyces beijingensis TaxID=1775926 RepID=A0ABP0ZSI5_9ASCO